MKKIIVLLFIAVFINKPPLGRKINYDHPLGRGIEAAYMFNGKTGGIAYDLSLNKYHGTLAPATDTLNMRVTDNFGPCLYFDGTHSYVDTGSTFQSTFQSSFSFSVWVKPDDGLPAASEYFGGTDSAGVVYFSLGSNGVPLFSYSAGGNSVNATTASALFSNGQEDWHHMVFVGDSTISASGGLKIYFDGTRPAAGLTGNTSSVTFSDYTSTRNLYIGAEHTAAGANSPLAGLIDNVVIYNRALTANEVHQLYRKKYCMIK